MQHALAMAEVTEPPLLCVIEWMDGIILNGDRVTGDSSGMTVTRMGWGLRVSKG